MMRLRARELEKVRAFDKEMKKMYHFDFFMAKFVGWGMLGMGAVCMMPVCMTPVVFEDKLDIMAVFLLVLYSWAVMMYLRPYMAVNEPGGAVSIYEKLHYMPVKSREIMAVRMEYLNRFCARMLIVNLAVGQLAMLFEQHWHLRSLVYPLFLGVLIWIEGLLYILPLRLQRRKHL